MNIQDLENKLFPIVAAALNLPGANDKVITETIAHVHYNDGYRDFITRDNSHLFRQYRNNVSADAGILVARAKVWSMQ